MVKIHVLGGPGSGKTTLGKELSAKLHIPHYDFDLYGEKNGTSAEAWAEESFSIAQQPGWVVENIAIIHIDPLLYAADHIVLLDVPWPVAAWRMLYRHIMATLHGTNRYPGFKSLYALLTSSRRYYLNINKRPAIAELMHSYLEQHTSTLPPTRQEVIEQLETYSALILPPTIEFVRSYLEKYGEKVIVVRTNADRARLLAFLTTRYHQQPASSV